MAVGTDGEGCLRVKTVHGVNEAPERRAFRSRVVALKSEAGAFRRVGRGSAALQRLLRGGWIVFDRCAAAFRALAWRRRRR
jgi:hypothetical protein